MANPAQETKIEIVTEAIEALVLATIVATLPARNPEEHRVNYQNVVDARETVSTAFRELLAPMLRVVVVEEPLPAKFRVVKNPPVEVAQFPGGIDDMNLG